MINVIIRKSRHCKVTVIITVLPPDIDLSLSLCGFDKVLRKKLALLIEVVCCALYNLVSDILSCTVEGTATYNIN